MKSHIILIAILISGIVNGTLNYGQKSVFSLDLEKFEKFRNLDLQIDQESIARAYGSRLVQSSSTLTADDYSEEYISSVFYEDPKLNDSYHLLEKYMEDYISGPADEINGSLVMEVLYYDHQFNFTPGMFIDVFSFGVGYLLGIPTSRELTTVEIRAAFYNMKGEKIVSYTGSGRSKQFQGLFFKRPNARTSNLDALKKALAEVHLKIYSDYEILIKKF